MSSNTTSEPYIKKGSVFRCKHCGIGIYSAKRSMYENEAFNVDMLSGLQGKDPEHQGDQSGRCAAGCPDHQGG